MIENNDVSWAAVTNVQRTLRDLPWEIYLECESSTLSVRVTCQHTPKKHIQPPLFAQAWLKRNSKCSLSIQLPFFKTAVNLYRYNFNNSGASCKTCQIIHQTVWEFQQVNVAGLRNLTCWYQDFKAFSLHTVWLCHAASSHHEKPGFFSGLQQQHRQTF